MLKPLGDRIVVKVIEDTEQTQGGIFIPDSAKEKPQKGEVVAVGLGKMNDKGEREPLDVEVGQKVLYAKYAGLGFRLQSIIVFIQPAGHASIKRCIAFETMLSFLLNASVIIDVANA